MNLLEDTYSYIFYHRNYELDKLAGRMGMPLFVFGHDMVGIEI